MTRDKASVQTKAGNPNRTDIPDADDPGYTPREVGITTRDASGHDGDVPKTEAPRPPLPNDDGRPDDGAPTAVEDFAPRHATPPTVSP